MPKKKLILVSRISLCRKLKNLSMLDGCAPRYQVEKRGAETRNLNRELWEQLRVSNQGRKMVTINDLPDEILLIIFNYVLSAHDENIIRLYRECPRGGRELYTDLYTLEDLKCPIIPIEFVKYLLTL